jgi:hypothetical protein
MCRIKPLGGFGQAGNQVNCRAAAFITEKAILSWVPMCIGQNPVLSSGPRRACIRWGLMCFFDFVEMAVDQREHEQDGTKKHNQPDKIGISIMRGRRIKQASKANYNGQYTEYQAIHTHFKAFLNQGVLMTQEFNQMRALFKHSNLLMPDRRLV